MSDVVVVRVEWTGGLGVTEHEVPVAEYREALALADALRGIGAAVRVTSGRGVRTLVAVTLAILTAACGERPAPVVAAPVVAPAPVPVVVAEEPEPAAWRCVREGRCAVPVEIDGRSVR
jgi:hypothetical protein